MTDLKRSWVESANRADSPFPLNNLPYGVFSTSGSDPRCGGGDWRQDSRCCRRRSGGHYYSRQRAALYATVLEWLDGFGTRRLGRAACTAHSAVA